MLDLLEVKIERIKTERNNTFKNVLKNIRTLPFSGVFQLIFVITKIRNKINRFICHSSNIMQHKFIPRIYLNVNGLSIFHDLSYQCFTCDYYASFMPKCVFYRVLNLKYIFRVDFVDKF